MEAFRARMKRAAESFAPPALYARGPAPPPTVSDWAEASRGGDSDGLSELCKLARSRKPRAGAGAASRRALPKTSRFVGVYRASDNRRWEAQARFGGRPVSLGKFKSERRAARVRDLAAVWLQAHDPPKKAFPFNFLGEMDPAAAEAVRGMSFGALLRTLRSSEEAAQNRDPAELF